MTDAVVVGTGAGGAPLAWRLCKAGFDVVLLEKGPEYQRSDYLHDEVLMRSKGDFFVPSTQDEPHVLVDHAQETVVPTRSSVGWIACCVGGGTAHMGGSFYRFHPDDFRLRTYCDTQGSIENWPYTYADLEPYYAEAEWVVGVSGAVSRHPFDVARSRPYPMPPLQSHPLVHWFDEACGRLNLHPFHTPQAINSTPYAGRPACAHCDFCAGYGCPTGARGSTQETFVARALATGRCDLRAGAMVHQILMKRDGRARGVVYFDSTGAEHQVCADIVVVSCSAVESARLLLLSTSPQFPNGLANGHGLVGRHLQFHTSSSGRGQFTFAKHQGKHLDDRNAYLVRSIVDHYFLPSGVSSIPKGGVFRFDLEQPSPLGLAEHIAFRSGDRALWGSVLKERLRDCWREARNLDFEVFHDFLPNQRTFVELDPEVRDKWGLPVARIHVDDVDHHKIAGAWLVDRGLEILALMGADDVRALGIGYRNTVMTAGTCRAGTDPTSSVVDEFCRVHEIPNLFVVDGSFMPTSGGAPCTLTIIANSIRTADYIIDRATSGDIAG